MGETDHDATDYDEAKEKILDRSTEYQGVLYRNENSTPYEELEGVDENMADIEETPPDGAMDLVREFY